MDEQQVDESGLGANALSGLCVQTRRVGAEGSSEDCASSAAAAHLLFPPLLLPVHALLFADLLGDDVRAHVCGGECSNKDWDDTTRAPADSLLQRYGTRR